MTDGAGAIVEAEDIAGQRLRVFRFILKAVGQVADAEDLAQRTLLTALERRHRYDGSSSLTTWLFGIALNHIHAYRYAQRRASRMDGEDALALLVADAEDPVVSLQRQREVLGLDHAIRQLPDTLREVIVLISLEDLTYEAAASVLGVPIGTVRSRLHRAKRILRKHMAATGSHRSTSGAAEQSGADLRSYATTDTATSN
jgi:RNA polymerase sigma-70 factor (ECF subfamily)